jgi:flagellin
MGISIRTDIGSRLTVTAFNQNWNDLYTSLERPATGRRINSAADDPAGLVISKQLQSQIASLNQEIENITATIGKYQTVSGSLGELREQLTELRSIAVGASNAAINDDAAQEAYAVAAESLVNTYNRTISNAQYNGAQTLDGSEGSLATVAQLVGIDLSSPESAAASIEAVDRAASALDQTMTELGATQRNDLESRRQTLEVTCQNLTAAESAITDTDYAMEMSSFTASLIRSQATMALLGHSFLTRQTVVSLMQI